MSHSLSNEDTVFLITLGKWLACYHQGVGHMAFSFSSEAKFLKGYSRGQYFYFMI